MIEPHNLTNFKLSKEHINEWRSTGCVVVNHLFPRNIINNAYSKLDDIFKENPNDIIFEDDFFIVYKASLINFSKSFPRNKIISY